ISNSSTESLISNTNVSDEEFENKQKVAGKHKKKTYVVKNPRRTSRLTGNSSIRNAEERFQHSTKTISRRFHCVLDAVCKLAQHIIRPIGQQFTDTLVKIRNDERYYPYFKNFIGVIDGTCISVVVPAEKKIPCIGRKGVTTTNVVS
ncbi:hypothetical protein S83_029329, partial [Arachis hypogaea]